jgi:transcriptional regulator with XRE-family HTH domain
VPPTVTAIIGGNVRYARAKRGLHQRELAAILDMSPGTISQIERGVRVVTVNELIPLCEALDIDLRFLLDGLDPDGMRRLGL